MLIVHCAPALKANAIAAPITATARMECFDGGVILLGVFVVCWYCVQAGTARLDSEHCRGISRHAGDQQPGCRTLFGTSYFKDLVATIAVLFCSVAWLNRLVKS
jgi:hypothetical protein